MKKIYFLGACALSVLFFACAPQNQDAVLTADFENVELKDGVLDSLSFESADVKFENVYTAEYGSWEGFACSSMTNTTTADYSNMYSVITGKAFSGKQFAVAFKGIAGLPTCKLSGGQEYEFQSLMITNGTYPYKAILDGNDYSRKFADGDWFKVNIKGVTAAGDVNDSIDVYLADFRDGKSMIVNSWVFVDLKPLGKINALRFDFSSTDNGEWGMNTPGYAYIDDLKYIIPAE